ncbi:MAG: toxin [Clostridia bacterium]|nr:toxin [Clostridia bacterium]
MYRSNGNIYDKLDSLAISLYVDYSINQFPINEKELCNKIGVSLVPYSAYEGKNRDLFLKRSKEGFLSYGINKLNPVIFYNDGNDAIYGNIRQTIFHEIKHFMCEDSENDEIDDDLAEHFGRYLACPTPYLIWKNITDVNEIISTFGVSATIANYVSSSVKNRINKYGHKIFDYEQPLIDLFY